MNTREALKLASFTLNQIPNTKINHDRYRNTYEVAAAVDKVLNECQHDHTVPGSVQREYVNKDGRCSKFALGHYDENDCFETDGAAPSLGDGRYDLTLDSDKCALCGKQI